MSLREEIISAGDEKSVGHVAAPAEERHHRHHGGVAPDQGQQDEGLAGSDLYASEPLHDHVVPVHNGFIYR